jgi:hypothetical protein
MLRLPICGFVKRVDLADAVTRAMNILRDRPNYTSRAEDRSTFREQGM